MSPTKLLSLFLSFCLILEQSVFAQAIDLSHYFVRNSSQNIPQSDKFRPLHLRYISYDNQANDFKILLDKGDFFNQKTEKPKNRKTSESLNYQTLELENVTQELMKYFFIGLALPNEKFWVNLRPDSPDNILDPELEKTDIGRIFLEADLQLKKDTSNMTSPQTKEGREYWDKLYKKAGELFGSENITIPTITRPWIVPGEIIIREAPDNAYIYKATLKVMLEEDYLRGTKDKRRGTTINYSFNDPRLKELNQYSTQLIKESIIPKLTYEVNTSKRYAQLRQVYYSLILAQWFKQKYGNSGSRRAPGTRAPVNSYVDLIDSGNLANLTSKEPYDKQTYFQQYQKSFKDGEYNLQEPVYTPMGQSIRRYVSGGIVINKARPTIIPASEEKYILERNYLISSDMYVVSSSISIAEKLVKGIVNKYRQSLGGYPIKVHCLNVKDELILALISALNNPELKSFSNQENFFIMMFELIENAIKHGEGYPVEIYFRAKENNLIIEVKDYGKGIDFEKLAELLRGAAIKKFIQEHGYMKGVPVVMPPGRNGFIMTKIMLPEEVEAFIRNSKSEIPFVSGLSIDEGRMIIGGVGLYAARRYAKDLGGDLTYETGPGGTTFIIKLPILSLASTGSAVKNGNVDSSEEKNNLEVLLKDNKLVKEKSDFWGLLGGLKKGDQVIEIGGPIVSIHWGVIAAALGARYRNYELEEKKHLQHKINMEIYVHLLKGFTGKCEQIRGRFSSGEDSISNKVDTEGYVSAHSQDVIIVLTGALSDPFPVSNAHEVFREMLRVIKPGGRFVIGTHGTWDEFEREKFEKVMNDVLVEERFKGKIKLNKIDNLGQRDYAGIYNFDVYEVVLTTSSALNEDKNAIGGIDFAALPIQTESVASSALGALPGAHAFKGDLDAEWARIQDVFNAGVRPSIQRLSEYTAAAVASPLAKDKIDQVRVMLADILRREEEDEKIAPVSLALKGLLIALESDKPASEFQFALVK